MVASPKIVQSTIATFANAAKANRQTPARDGALIRLTGEHAHEVMVTADLHGQRLHFNKLVRIADLGRHPRRHLIMQEVCHGGPSYPQGGCMSHLLLEDIAALKMRYADRFHFLLSNHELAEVTDYPIAKRGQMLNLQFRCGLQQMYGDAAPGVREAMVDFISSCPLAVRLANGIFVCHGSPDTSNNGPLDCDVFQRPLNAADLQPGGAAFRIVWGRDFRAKNAEALAKSLGAEMLLHGHEPCQKGFRVPNKRQVILDCCCPNASFVILPVTESITHAEIVQRIRRLRDVSPS